MRNEKRLQLHEVLFKPQPSKEWKEGQFVDLQETLIDLLCSGKMGIPKPNLITELKQNPQQLLLSRTSEHEAIEGSLYQTHLLDHGLLRSLPKTKHFPNSNLPAHFPSSLHPAAPPYSLPVLLRYFKLVPSQPYQMPSLLCKPIIEPSQAYQAPILRSAIPLGFQSHGSSVAIRSRRSRAREVLSSRSKIAP
jgi:hypothetical protein